MNALLEALGFVGDVLDAPRRGLWSLPGFLTGQGADPITAMLYPSKGVSGWDLTKALGIEGEEGMDPTDVASFGAEVLGDPLMWASGGLLAVAKLLGKGGKAAKAAGTAAKAAAPLVPVGHVTSPLQNALSLSKRPVHIPGMEGEFVADPIAQQILRMRPENLNALEAALRQQGIRELQPLSGGFEAVTLQTPEGLVVRLQPGGPMRPRPQAPAVLANTAFGHVGGVNYEIMPKIQTAGIGEPEIEAVKRMLTSQGLATLDMGADNLGWQGRNLKVIDPHAVVPRAMLAAPVAAKAAGTAAKAAAPGRTSMAMVPRTATALEQTAKAGAPRMAMVSRPPVKPAPMQMLGAPVAPFYSRLERAAQGLPQNVKLESLPNLLKKFPEGVLDEEIEWAIKGLPKKGVMAKGDVLKHIKENQIRVEEKILGGPEKFYQYVGPGHSRTFATRAEAVAYDQSWKPGMRSRGGVKEVPAAKTKHADLATPGGENYRELLLKLPVGARDDAVIEALRQEKRALYDRMNSGGQIGYNEYATRANAIDDKIKVLRGDYTEPHWPDDPNTFAHVRFDERVGPRGEKTMFLQEVQSRWHQTGAKEGYITPAGKPIAPPKVSFQETRSPIGTRELTTTTPNGMSVRVTETSRGASVMWGTTRESYPSVQDAIDAVHRQVADWVVKRGVPDAPFKGTAWAELAMKRMLKEATDNGYERIAWNTGELATKYASGAGPETDDALKILQAWAGRTNTPEFKELLKKNNTLRILHGNIAWYDKTLPDILKKLIGKDAKVERIPIPGGKELARTAETEIQDWIVQSVRVPHATKMRISRKGQALLTIPPLLATGRALYGQREQPEDPGLAALLGEPLEMGAYQ